MTKEALKQRLGMTQPNRGSVGFQEALAQPEEKSVAMADYMALTEKYVALKATQRTWVGLTLDERIDLAKDVDWPVGAYCEYAEKIEAKLKEKNELR
jgi:hypothetical protein